MIAHLVSDVLGLSIGAKLGIALLVFAASALAQEVYRTIRGNAEADPRRWLDRE